MISIHVGHGSLCSRRRKAENGHRRREKIPLDWATDKDGNPTDDPQKGFDGYFLPVGGFKGLGMAYAIDILCGVLTGGAFQNHIRNMSTAL